MFIVVGGTGHVGAEVALALLKRGKKVTVVGHEEAKRDEWTTRGAAFASVDIRNVHQLRNIFARGRRAFLLNPPASPATDVDAEERRGVQSMLTALTDSGLEKVVVQSTYGAKQNAHCGDLGVLYELERDIRRHPIRTSIMRAAFLFTNWDSSLHSAMHAGSITSMFPAHLKIPMVSPIDLGQAAADLLLSDDDLPLQHVEGPHLYSSNDVADAFSRVLERAIRLDVIPSNEWADSFKSKGFSDVAAASYACMTAATVEGDIEIPDQPRRPLQRDQAKQVVRSVDRKHAVKDDPAGYAQA